MASKDIGTQPKLRLFRGALVPGSYVTSPFVTKLEFRLRYGDVPYIQDGGSPWNGPTHKIPFIELKDETQAKPLVLGDSALIFHHMIENDGLRDLNHWLSPEQKAEDLGLRALLEDKLYFYHMRECWIDNYYVHRDDALSPVPYPIRIIVGNLVYRKVVRTLYGQGVGRYTSEQVDFFRREVWGTINDALATVASRSDSASSEPFWYLGGDEPTEADFTLFGFMSSVLTGKNVPGSKQLLQGLPAIMDYSTRIHERYFWDYDNWPVPKYTDGHATEKSNGYSNGV